MKIKYIGSKFFGQADWTPEDLEKLKDLLRNVPLDPRFEDCGSFYSDGRLFGNFLSWSHVFWIGDPDAELVELVRANQASRGYRLAKMLCRWGAVLHGKTQHVPSHRKNEAFPSLRRRLRVINAELEAIHNAYTASIRGVA